MPTDSDQSHLMVDRHEVVETVYRYATGIDTRDFELYRSIFTDEVEIDFSSYLGIEPGWMKVPAELWVESVKSLFLGLDATQHSMTNPIVTIDGDEATCVMYMQAEHFLQNEQGDASYTIGGYYTDDLVRTDDGWRIRRAKLTVFWHRGNKHVMTLATERTAATSDNG